MLNETNGRKNYTTIRVIDFKIPLSVADEEDSKKG